MIGASSAPGTDEEQVALIAKAEVRLNTPTLMQRWLTGGQTWPAPRPGLVVRFSYLWKREADAGREEGVKDRPCAVVIAIEGREAHPRVIVLPVTHSPPQPPDEGIERCNRPRPVLVWTTKARGSS